MHVDCWTDAFLDNMRTLGDDPADKVVQALFEQHDVEGIRGLMDTLVKNDDIPSDLLPPVIRDYLQDTAAPLDLDKEKISRGEHLFEIHGPEILLILGFYSLPADYAAKRGIKVLSRTNELSQRPFRRVIETAQMVVDVMAEGGLEPNGRGVRSAQKVRLMHAAIRYLILHDQASPWDHSLGVPINQEDLAGTLMSFSYIVLDGLKRLSISLSDADREAYFYTWMVIGGLMGIDPKMIPANVDEGRALTEKIYRRQIAPSEEARALTSALLTGYGNLLPKHLQGVPASLVRFFLEKDSFDHRNIAEMLGVPPADWTEHVALLAVHADEFLTRIGIENPIADKIIAYVNIHIIQKMLLVERGGNRAPFYIPDKLKHQWGIGAATEAQ